MKLSKDRKKKLVEVRVSSFTLDLLQKYNTQLKLAEYIDELIKMYHKSCIEKNIPVYDILPVKINYDKDKRIRISHGAADYLGEIGMANQTMEDIILSVFLTYYHSKEEFMTEIEILKVHSVPMRRLAVDGIRDKYE